MITKQGPSLVGVVGRRAGSLPHFTYTSRVEEVGIYLGCGDAGSFPGQPDDGRAGHDYAHAGARCAKPRGCDCISFDAENSGGRDAEIYDSATARRRERPERLAARSSGRDTSFYRGRFAGALCDAFRGQRPASGAATGRSATGRAARIHREKVCGGTRASTPSAHGAEWRHFIVETARGRIRVMRTADGADAPTVNQNFAEGLDRPFGIAFYPPGNDPKWLYVANNQFRGAIPLSQRRFRGERARGSHRSTTDGNFPRRPYDPGRGVFEWTANGCSFQWAQDRTWRRR